MPKPPTPPATTRRIAPVVRPRQRPLPEILIAPSPVTSTPSEERDETEGAIAQIAAHTNTSWRTHALESVAGVARDLPTLTTEDVWLYLREHFHEVGVHDNRAMGPIMRAAQKAGWIARRPGSYQDAERMSHGRPLRVWESRLCRG